MLCIFESAHMRMAGCVAMLFASPPSAGHCVTNHTLLLLRQVVDYTTQDIADLYSAPDKQFDIAIDTMGTRSEWPHGTALGLIPTSRSHWNKLPPLPGNITLRTRR
jgi:hypothetical protein